MLSLNGGDIVRCYILCIINMSVDNFRVMLSLKKYINIYDIYFIYMNNMYFIYVCMCCVCAHPTNTGYFKQHGNILK